MAAVVLQPLRWLDASRGHCDQGLRLRGKLIGRCGRSVHAQELGQERTADVWAQKVRRQHRPVAEAPNLDIEATRLQQQALRLPPGSSGGDSDSERAALAG